MVIVHVAYIDTGIIGGVQHVVPQIIKAQAKYASVALVNRKGDSFKGIQNILFNGEFNEKKFPAPFDKPDLVVFHELYRFQFIKIYKYLKIEKIPYIIIHMDRFLYKRKNVNF